VSDLHAALAILAAIAGGATLLLVAAAAVRGRTIVQPWTDRAILAALALVLANVLVGAGIAVGGRRPADPLHYLYAILAIIALPIARFGGGESWAHRRALVIALGAIVLVGLVVRLVQTGGG
jgi:hypothetical protein